MSNPNNGSGNVWAAVIFIVGFAALLQLLSGISNSGSSPSSAPATVDTNSFDYRYAKERFKQEGLNNADADTAAKAVIKFNEAQKARGR